MKYFYLVFLASIAFTTSLYGFSSIPLSKDVKPFYWLLKKGYVRKYNNKDVIYRFPKKTLICIYNDDPNTVAKTTLKRFFRLLKSEFDFGEQVHVKNLESCPQNSHIFFQLRDELNYYKSLGGEFKKVFENKGIKTRIYNSVGRMGFGAIRIRKDKTIGFATVFQMTKHIGDKVIDARVNELIIEELYQTIAMGRDVDVEEKPKSILNEVNFTYGGGPDHRDDVDIDAFKSRGQKNPLGLCGYDLWFLLTVSKFDKRIIPFEDFLNKLDQDFFKIKKRALEIENNPAYKGLFDQRCSGENSGINTKIGIK